MPCHPHQHSCTQGRSARLPSHAVAVCGFCNLLLCAAYICTACCSPLLQDCMASMVPFAKAHTTQNDNRTLSTDFSNLCLSSSTLNSTDLCSSVAFNITKTPNLAKRAAGLCQALQLCDKSLPVDCTVSVVSSSTNNTVSVAANALSACTVEGIPKTSSDATLLPGFVASLVPLPSGFCATAGDCGDASYYDCR